MKKQFVQIKVTNLPVAVGKGLIGIVVSHPVHQPGTEVVSTHVQSVEGNRVETRNSVYELL